jgi:hypothetical protein
VRELERTTGALKRCLKYIEDDIEDAEERAAEREQAYDDYVTWIIAEIPMELVREVLGEAGYTRRAAARVPDEVEKYAAVRKDRPMLEVEEVVRLCKAGMSRNMTPPAVTKSQVMTAMAKLIKAERRAGETGEQTFARLMDEGHDYARALTFGAMQCSLRAIR